MSENIGMFPVSPSELTTNLRHILRANLVANITSSPGVGKSMIVAALAKKARCKLIDLRLSQMDPTELQGYPSKDPIKNTASYVPFDVFPLEGDSLPLDPDYKPDPNFVPTAQQPEDPKKFLNGWIIFLDELSNAPKQTLAAAYKLILDRQIGFRNLHEKVWIICAGNRKADRALANEIGSALQSRLVHLQLESNLKDWLAWAVDADIDPRIQGFLQFSPQYLNDFKPEIIGKTFACERTWEMLSKLIKGQSNTDLENMMPLMAGAVGAGAAMEFVNFIKIFATLPKISEIVNDPMGTSVPSDPGTRFAMALHISEHIDITIAKPLLTYMARLNAEAQAVAARLMNKKKPEVIKTAEFAKIFVAIAKYL